MLEFQSFWIISRTFVSCSQRGLKRNGIGPRFLSVTISRRMGLWSEPPNDKILDVMFKPSNRKVSWTKNLSSLAAMCPRPVLLLFHVYFPVVGLMSISSHVMMVSSTRFVMGSLVREPPLLSCWLTVTFRSPARIILPCSLLLSSWSRVQQFNFSA